MVSIVYVCGQYARNDENLMIEYIRISNGWKIQLNPYRYKGEKLNIKSEIDNIDGLVDFLNDYFGDKDSYIKITSNIECNDPFHIIKKLKPTEYHKDMIHNITTSYNRPSELIMTIYKNYNNCEYMKKQELKTAIWNAVSHITSIGRRYDNTIIKDSPYKKFRMDNDYVNYFLPKFEYEISIFTEDELYQLYGTLFYMCNKNEWLKLLRYWSGHDNVFDLVIHTDVIHMMSINNM